MTVPQHEFEQEEQPPEVPRQPLNVKEQLEATASRFWSSVTKTGRSQESDESMRVPGVPIGLFSQRSCGTYDDEEDDILRSRPSTAQHSLQFVVNAMFSSCTTGGPFTDDDGSSDEALKKTTRSQSGTLPTAGTTVTPDSSFDPERVSQSPQRKERRPLPRPVATARSALQETSKNLFKNNHEIAEEAIKHLRRQQQRELSKQNNESTVFASTVAVDLERDDSSPPKNHPSAITPEPKPALPQQPDPQSKSFLPRSVSLKSQKGAVASPPGKVTPTRSRKGHSFFPASRPRDPPGRTRQEQRAREKKERIKGVPKEVEKASSPPRLFRKRTKQKRVLDGVPGTKGTAWDGTESEDSRSSVSWDINNDGISEITQTTVDRMVFAISQQLLVFPEEADNLNRIHSDLTDPAPNRQHTFESDYETSVEGSVAQDYFPMVGGVLDGFKDDFGRMVTPPRVRDASEKGMSPSLLEFTCTAGSVGTRSFFTKTTHSSQTTNFASAWRRDEQQFWDKEVAKEQGKREPPTKVSKPGRTGSGSSRKSWTKFKGRRSGATTATTSITTATTLSPRHARKLQQLPHQGHDRLMDDLVLREELEHAEI